MPARATGFGPLSMAEFAEALREALESPPAGLEELRVVLRKKDDADLVRATLERDA